MSLQHAYELQRQGRYDEAVIELQGLLVDEPSNVQALTQLARCQRLRGHPREALEELDRAEAVGGATAATARERGDALYKLKRYAEAGSAYDEADALGDRSTWVLIQLSRCRRYEGDREGARDAAARAVEREPESADSWGAMAEVALASGDLAQAEAHYQRAHELAPKNQFVYSALIEARVRQLPAEQRERELQVVMRSSGKGNRFLSGVLARVRKELGDNEGAAAAWGSTPDDLIARRNEGFSLAKAGRLDEAAAILRESLFRDPENIVLFTQYVRLQYRREAWEELRTALEDLAPQAGPRRGAVLGELRKLKSRLP